MGLAEDVPLMFEVRQNLSAAQGVCKAHHPLKTGDLAKFTRPTSRPSILQ